VPVGGIRMSVSTRSGSSTEAIATSDPPSATAPTTSIPCCDSRLSPSRSSVSSSPIRTRMPTLNNGACGAGYRERYLIDRTASMTASGRSTWM
jgi:hypothetical protein